MNLLNMTTNADVPSLVPQDSWMESDNRRKEMLTNLANEVVNTFVTLQLGATFNFQDDRENAYACEVLSLGLLNLDFHGAEGR